MRNSKHESDDRFKQTFSIYADISSTVTDLSRILEAEMSPADNWSQIFLPKFSWR